MMVCGPWCVTGTGHSSTPMSSVDPPLVTGRALMVITRVCVCVCVCERERERETESVYVSIMYVCGGVCVNQCLYVCMRVCVCVCELITQQE